jgi:hypothetical protein
LETFEITLQFPDLESCADFQTSVSQSELEHDDFGIALADSQFNFDNNAISLVVTFFQHGGLGVIAAVATLLKVLLNKPSPRHMPAKGRFVHIATKGGEVDINTNMSATEIRDLLNAKIFRK